MPDYTFGMSNLTEDVDVSTTVFLDAHYDSVLKLVTVINKNLVTLFKMKDLPKHTKKLTYDELSR